MRRATVLSLVLGALGLGPALAAQTDTDAERSAWKYRRTVTLPASGQGRFALVPVPPDVAARGQADLGDLRLLAADGSEVPFVVDRAVAREGWSGVTGRLVDTRQVASGSAEEGRGHGVWVADLGDVRRFDTLTLQIPDRDFAKRVRVEGSLDRQAWRLLRDDASVFDAPWTTPTRVHHNTIALAAPETARYVRLTLLDDRRSPAVAVTGVTATETRRVQGEDEDRNVDLEPLGQTPPRSRYRLHLPSRFPFEQLSLETTDLLFARRVRLLEQSDKGAPERTLAEGMLYRLRLEDSALAGESLTLRLSQRPEAGTLLLEIDDGDSPPLRGLRIRVGGAVARLLFASAASPLTLYYGNEVTRAPRYDLQPLRDRLALSGELDVAHLGAESENPRYRKAAPLPFTAARGASVEASAWRSVRRITLGGQEDLWTLTLAPADLGQTRPDLGDLRVIDEKDRQVPYILEAAAAEQRVAMTVETLAGSGRSDGRRLTRHRLSLRGGGTSHEALALPLTALELDTQEAFFDRPARLLAPPGPGERHERTLFAGRLARTVDARAPQTSPVRPILLALDGSRLSDLILEVDEGDNAPLSLQAVHAVVRVPRVTFKAAPGEYRLLLGNREAAAPRYDLASLRQEVLSYSAVDAQAAAREANPRYRRFAGDYFKNAPPTVLLWGTLLAAVAALLFLTARVLRQPPGPSDDQAGPA